MKALWHVSGLRSALRTPILLVRGLNATRYARSRHGPGLAFAAFGRRAGLRALVRGSRSGLDLLLTPVSIVRYWEFPFVLRNLPEPPGHCLDVASPRLFSCFVARRRHPTTIRIVNPDARDANATEALAQLLGIRSISVEPVPVAALAGTDAAYDSIWSISVIEHIPGDGDAEAMAILWRALRPGGRLILTVPVDRKAWDEFRESDIYGIDVPHDERGYFFQRWYDEKTLGARILEPIGRPLTRFEWFGERQRGRFAAYEEEWIRTGYARTVDDPREIVDHYAQYQTWDAMPGRGVVGLVIDKADT